MNSSFPSFSSPSTPSSYSKRKKVVLLVFFCILFGGIFFLFGAFEIVRGMMTMSSSASLGESSVQQQVYKRSDEKNRGWKGEDEEGEDDEDDDAIETNARDRRREYDAESRTTTRMSESEEMMFQTRLASASEKCLRAPYPQVLGDNGETLKRAQTNMKEFEMRHGNVKDMVSENKKRWRAEGSPGKEIAKTGRRRSRNLLAYAKSHPLEQKCRGERRYRASKYGRSTAHKHLKDCMNRLEDCANAEDARKTAKSMPGVKLLTQIVKNKIACLTVSKSVIRGR